MCPLVYFLREFNIIYSSVRLCDIFTWDKKVEDVTQHRILPPSSEAVGHLACHASVPVYTKL